MIVAVVQPARRRVRLAIGVLLGAVLAAALLLPAPGRTAEVMRSFHAAYDLQADGSFLVTEVITWDFGAEPRHGIFRDLVNQRKCQETQLQPGSTPEEPIYRCRPGYRRDWPIEVVAVGARQAPAPAAPAKYSTEQAGDGVRVKIGDPDRVIAGPWTYTITYRLEGALDSYEDNDEFYWDATGSQWPVAIEKTTIEVTGLPTAGLKFACFEGYNSRRPCLIEATDGGARFTASRALYPNEELTIVAGWDRGAIAIPPPILRDVPSPGDYFELDPVEYGGVAGAGLFSVFGLVSLWWRHGRDRRYRTMYYLTNDPGEQTKPLFARQDVVVEYVPPEELRPAQMGLILDERADPLDVTATIIDLAVRGYLHITEIPKEGFFGKSDWQLTKLKDVDDSLLPYEQTILRGLFDSTAERQLSELKLKFYDDLAAAQKQLYSDAMQRKWFNRKPGTSKGLWLVAGIVLTVLGVGVTVGSAVLFGRLLIGLPVVFAGPILMVLSRAMSRRTAAGSEALRRVLGFRLFIDTAETRRQEFNEQQGIFERYLPFAIVFGCVERWAKAFEGLDAAANMGWYTGTAAFTPLLFSHTLNSFSSSVGSTIVSAPSSGGSGFSGGGGSGGGGGGGGGGSW
ncbi:MAG: DUF2207 domain-containing protein [Dehalococcoidia bacterium]